MCTTTATVATVSACPGAAREKQPTWRPPGDDAPRLRDGRDQRDAGEPALGCLPGGAHRWQLAVGAGQDAHEVAAHALDVRAADHLGPLPLELRVNLLHAAEQLLPTGGEAHRPLPPILRVRAALKVPAG